MKILANASLYEINASYLWSQYGDLSRVMQILIYITP